VEPGVKFISDEIKPDIDSMAVQIFTDLPEDNPFQLADTAQDDVLVHQQTEPVYQQLTIEDPRNDVAQSLEGVCFKIVRVSSALNVVHLRTAMLK